MVVPDPSAALLHLVTKGGDPPTLSASPSAQREAMLIRRRFGLALPPPFAGPVEPSSPVRVAVAADGAAIAAVKWRAFGMNYRGGVLPDGFLDHRQVVPPPSFWVGRAMVPPSRRHRLLVWGRPGTVFGYLDAGPVHPEDQSEPGPDQAEVHELYVDPAVQGLGGGGRLLAAAEEWMASVGFVGAELSALLDNEPAHRFYEAHGWLATGRTIEVDLGIVAFTEARYARTLGAITP